MNCKFFRRKWRWPSLKKFYPGINMEVLRKFTKNSFRIVDNPDPKRTFTTYKSTLALYQAVQYAVDTDTTNEHK